jgi:hypothetical protein
LAGESSKAEGKKPVFTADDMTTAEWFWKTIEAMQPGRKAPKLKQWANTVRLMRDRDGRTIEQIRALFERVQRDSFWRVNVLSPDKLREKWDDLNLRLQENVNGTGKHNGRRPAVDRAGPGQVHDTSRKVEW